MDVQSAWNYLYSVIGNEYGVAAMLGNMQSESGLSSTNVQNSYESTVGDDATYTAGVDNGTISREQFISDGAGYGLCPWTSESRKAGLYDYCQSKGVSIGDEQAQLEYLAYELETLYPSTFKAMKNASSVREASDEILHKFEAPYDQSEETEKFRASLGETLYEKYQTSSAVLEKVEEWLTKVDSVDFDSLSLSSTFAPLTDFGILSNYISSINKMLESLELKIDTMATEITGGYGEQEETDDKYVAKNDATSFGTTYTSGSSGSTDGSRGTEVDSKETPIYTPTPDTEPETTKIELDEASLLIILTELYNLSMKGELDLEKYLTDPNFAKSLRRVILFSPNISDEIKEVILKMDDADAKILQTSLKELVGDQPLDITMDEITLEIMPTFLENISSKTGKTLEQVTADESLFDSLKEAKSVLEKNKTQEGLVKIYDGSVSSTDNNAIEYLRNVINNMADEKGVTPETLLSDASLSSYISGEINGVIESLGKIEKLSGDSRSNFLMCIVSASKEA